MEAPAGWPLAPGPPALKFGSEAPMGVDGACAAGCRIGMLALPRRPPRRPPTLLDELRSGLEVRVKG